MDGHIFPMCTRLVIATLAGSLVGLERTYHGRAAGFRTHALVCSASALLMQLTGHQWPLLDKALIETLRVDPTRMAQGIMTGIGFLGAGVIVHDRLTIRGLTTAASIWMTAAIGILIGIGYYSAGGLAAFIAIGTLSFFRWVESAIPSERYGWLIIDFHRAQKIAEAELIKLIKEHAVLVASRSYSLRDEGRIIRFQLTVRTKDIKNFSRLASTLSEKDGVLEFSLMPTGH